LVATLTTRRTESDEERLLAAAEVVAAARGKPAANIPQSVVRWLAQERLTVDTELEALARTAVDGVRGGSGLSRLWEEAGELADWRMIVDDLALRLRA
jgi:hypothetical protein